MKRWQATFSLALAAWCCWSTPALAESPTEYVRGIMERVTAIQTNPTLAGEAHQTQRGQQIHQIIERSFDFTAMAKDALGPAYGQLGEGQRQEFMETFSHLFQDSYTRMVLNFLKKENISYNRESLKDNEAKVYTTIVWPNESIPATYLLRRVGGGWLIYDVNVDGVSILEIYRTEFTHTIRTEGFRVLLKRMKAQRQVIM